MLTIGITGEVGSGKSFIAEYIHKNVHSILLLADDIGREVSSPKGACYDKIINAFGAADREKLADIIFHNEEKKKLLEAIIHPVVMAYIKSVIDENTDNKGIIIVESAILFESGADKLCDETWFIYVDESVRRKRLKQSRNYSDEKIDAILANQKSYDYYLSKSDKIINNSNSENETIYQVGQILELHSFSVEYYSN
jgi:dephospho-CoA kinase